MHIYECDKLILIISLCTFSIRSLTIRFHNEIKIIAQPKRIKSITY